MKKERKRALKDKERIIVEFIHKIGGYVTPNEISKETGLAYLTVLKYVEILEKEQIIKDVNKGKSKHKKYSINDKILQ